MITKFPSKRVLPLHTALKHSLADIERRLDVKVAGIERITKIYGSNANSFLIKTLSRNNRINSYFLKFNDNGHIERELEGTELIRKYLPTPKVIMVSKKALFTPRWMLLDYTRGSLMSERFLRINNKKTLDLFCGKEELKEKLLRKLHSQPKRRMNYDEYLATPTNKLFYHRLYGDTFRSFYMGSPDNISSYFDHRIIVNGKEYPHTINQIFESIRRRYASNRSKRVAAIQGHGDAHHGNIIVNRDIWFIDNEYAGFIPPFMELAKPYYNDFIGTLFYHHHKAMNHYFKIERFEESGSRLALKIKCSRRLNKHLKVTNIKLRSRKKLVNRETSDFLTLNDYLILCHTLTKDPNTYPVRIQRLFIVFTAILAQFDPLKPESLYDFL